MKFLAIASLVSIAACDTAGGAGAFDERASEIEGIYQVSAYTRNEAACEPGGDSQLVTDTFALVTRMSVAGIDYVAINSCASPADCRVQYDKLQTGEPVAFDWSFAVHAIAGDGGLVGEGASTGFSTPEGICRLGDITATRLTVTGSALRIEQRITLADDYAEDADGFCTTTAAREAAQGNPCAQFELLTAELVEAL